MEGRFRKVYLVNNIYRKIIKEKFIRMNLRVRWGLYKIIENVIKYWNIWIKFFIILYSLLLVEI